MNSRFLLIHSTFITHLFLSANSGVLPFLMGEVVRKKKNDSAFNYKHQQMNLKRLKAACAARVEMFGNKRASKLPVL